MRRLSLVAVALFVGLPLAGAAQGADPRNMTECVQMTRAPLEAQCRSIFSRPDQEAERGACLERVGPQLEALCQQFFGEGTDFCATCTSSCTKTFPSGEGKRRECLAMCMRQPGCQ